MILSFFFYFFSYATEGNQSSNSVRQQEPLRQSLREFAHKKSEKVRQNLYAFWAIEDPSVRQDWLKLMSLQNIDYSSLTSVQYMGKINTSLEILKLYTDDYNRERLLNGKEVLLYRLLIIMLFCGMLKLSVFWGV